MDIVSKDDEIELYTVEHGFMYHKTDMYKCKCFYYGDAWFDLDIYLYVNITLINIKCIGRYNILFKIRIIDCETMPGLIEFNMTQTGINVC